MSRTLTPSSPLAPARSSWAGDLVHPLPLGAVAVMAVNDHLLKGAGVLPGWLTGKISDFAGLFFFPVLLAAVARGTSTLVLGRDVRDRRALAAVAGLVTGAVFTAVKLYPPFNAWIAGFWGVMRLDPTDLFALPMIPLSAAFLVRSTGSADASASTARARSLPVNARRFVDFAAVLTAGLASAATSSAPPPPPVPPPQPVAVPEAAVAVAEPTTPCATLTLNICERSASGTFVVVKATGVGPGSCEMDVAEAVEIVPNDGLVNVEMLPARVVVKESDSTTFSLSFLRPVDPGRITEDVTLRLQVRGARANGDSITQSVDVSQGCVRR